MLISAATNSSHPGTAQPLRQTSNFSSYLLSIPLKCSYKLSYLSTLYYPITLSGWLHFLFHTHTHKSGLSAEGFNVLCFLLLPEDATLPVPSLPVVSVEEGPTSHLCLRPNFQYVYQRPLSISISFCFLLAHCPLA